MPGGRNRGKYIGDGGVTPRRRKHHREPVVILASVSTRTQPFGEATIVNLSEGGVKLRTAAIDFVEGVSVNAGEQVDLRLALPDSGEMLDIAGHGGMDDRGRLRRPFSLHPRGPAARRCNNG